MKNLKKKKEDLDYKLNDILTRVNESIEMSHVAVNNRKERNGLIETKMRYDNTLQG